MAEAAGRAGARMTTSHRQHCSPSDTDTVKAAQWHVLKHIGYQAVHTRVRRCTRDKFESYFVATCFGTLPVLAVSA